MSLIHDIQAEAIDAVSSVSVLLRKCKLLAARVGHDEFGRWVEAELSGYPDDMPLPDYRVVAVRSYGMFVGEFQRANRLQIPLSVLPEEHREKFGIARLDQAISSYENLVQGDKPPAVQLPWSAGVALHYASKAVLDMQCVEAWTEIPIGAIDRLLNSVKNAVLGYAIDLEKLNPGAGDLPMGSKPVSEEKLTQIFHTNITGDVGNVANGGSGISQQATVNVGAGDWETLRRVLQSIGLRDADMHGLQADLEEARAQGTGMSGKPEGWLGRLIVKATAGAAGVGVEAAAAGIAKALAAYLGLS